MLAVIRHGDRTPKQKMKMKVSEVRHTAGTAGTAGTGRRRRQGRIRASCRRCALHGPFSSCFPHMQIARTY